MIIKEPITTSDDIEYSSTSSVLQYVIFTVFIILAIVSVVACAVLYDTRTPETVAIDSPKTNPITIHAYTIQCTHNDKYYCSEYKVYKVIKD